MWCQWLLAVVGLSAVLAQSPFYNVPDPLLEALKPKGLRISIPDEPGVELFAIHANVNKPLEGLAGGQLSRDIIKATNGRWVYEDLRVRLKPGDKIYYWLYVQADGLGYRKDDQTWEVRELVDGSSTDTVIPNPPTASPSCQPTLTTVNGKPSCSGQQIFEEMFDSLSSSKWQHVVQIASDPDFAFVAYTNDHQNSFVRNGNLNVKPTIYPGSDSDIRTQKLVLSGCTSVSNMDLCERQADGWNILPPASSARLRTLQTFSFCYGKVEIRAKLPAGDWIFPELWLEPKDNFYGRSSYESGQIRLAMARGNRDLSLSGNQIGARQLEAGCRLGSDNKNVQDHMNKIQGQGFWSDEYHTYSLLWTADKITFSVDDREIGSVAPPQEGFGGSSGTNPWTRGTKMAPFDKEFYISLGLGVGGLIDFPDNCMSANHPKPWKNKEPKAMLNFWREKDKWYPTWSGDASTLQVDYVRVWAL